MAFGLELELELDTDTLDYSVIGSGGGNALTRADSTQVTADNSTHTADEV